MIARERCAECHLTGKEKGRSTNESAPTFAKIANIPGMTATALRAALNTSHGTMPNLVIKDGHKVENGVLSLLSTFGFLHEAEIGLAML